MEAIVTGELAQGQKLSEVDLARRYGISRGPLREAMRELEGMRLVTRVPHAGARVVRLDLNAIAELYRVREALEGMACRLAAQCMPPEQIQAMFALLDVHEVEIQAADGTRYFQRQGDFDFHFHIVRGACNSMLSQLLTGELYQLLRMCRHQSSLLLRRPERALLQHRQIADAIAERDGELAELLMRRHIHGAWESIRHLEGESA